MHMIADTKLALSKDEWVREIGKKFGEAARFHTCAAKNLTAAELMDFIGARGKFTGSADALSLDASAICQH